MKTLAISFFFIMLFAFARAQQSTDDVSLFQIIVTVDNARSDEGKMLFSLATKDQFMREQPFKSAVSTIEEGVATVTFTDVPQGEYAVLVLQDINNNGQMDFETNGMPAEDWGMSNNKVTNAAPTWSDAKITVDRDMKVIIKI